MNIRESLTNPAKNKHMKSCLQKKLRKNRDRRGIAMKGDDLRKTETVNSVTYWVRSSKMGMKTIHWESLIERIMGGLFNSSLGPFPELFARLLAAVA